MQDKPMTPDQPKRNRGGETIKTCSCKAYKLEIERLEEENKSSDITIEKLGDFSRTLLERSERLEAENRVEKDWAENKIKEIKGLKSELAAVKEENLYLKTKIKLLFRDIKFVWLGITSDPLLDKNGKEAQKEADGK